MRCTEARPLFSSYLDRAVSGTEMHEISGATHYYAGSDQRDKLRQAVDIVTDWLARHDFAEAE